MRTVTAIIVTSVLAAPLVACGDDTGSTIKTITYTGKLVNGADSTPIAGAHICFVSEPTLACVDTNATGDYTIGNLPANKKVEVEVTATGFISVRSNFITRDTDFSISAQMFQPEAVSLAFTAAGETVDTGKGGLLVRVYDPAVGQTQGLAGVKVTIAPEDGVGPYYADGLTLTDGDATTAVGNALFANLEAKTYKVSFESADHTCNGTQLWKTSDGRVDAEVKLGFATYLYVDCSAN
ncbi:MAG: carboxypeptidase regulatory-like domain-containing protein [Myxococcota bacterium]